MIDRILRIDELVTTTGVSRSSLYAWMQSGHFPRPVKMGLRAVGWRASVVEAWLESRSTQVEVSDDRD